MPQPADVRTAFRRWLETVNPPALSPDEGERFAQRIGWQRELYDAGWMRLGSPEEYGARHSRAARRAALERQEPDYDQVDPDRLRSRGGRTTTTAVDA